ncbi:MAG: hypothetical protein MJ231_04620 [bacterium]|nr:hypothetical protein [bacterium]
MIPAINNFLTSPLLVNLSQNTAARVSCETGMKAVGRPAFVLMDKDLDSSTKKYSSAKELLYQLICLGVYLAVIPTVFKRGTFALAKNGILKNTPGKGVELFKNGKQYLQYREIANLDKAARTRIFENKIDVTITDAKKKKQAQNLLEKHRKTLENLGKDSKLYNALKNEENPEKYNLLYNALETGSYFGSLIGLAILAPEISHHLIHPIMKAFGLEKDQNK